MVGGTAFFAPNTGRQYDVSPDGRRFLLIKIAPPTDAVSASPLQLVVVQNWLDELKRLVTLN